jgi:hypothetical protein
MNERDLTRPFNSFIPVLVVQWQEHLEWLLHIPLFDPAFPEKQNNNKGRKSRVQVQVTSYKLQVS